MDGESLYNENIEGTFELLIERINILVDYTGLSTVIKEVA
jgi:hypothetical protein